MMASGTPVGGNKFRKERILLIKANTLNNENISVSLFCAGRIGLGLAIGVVHWRSESIEKYSSCGRKGAKKERKKQAGQIFFTHYTASSIQKKSKSG